MLKNAADTQDDPDRGTKRRKHKSKDRRVASFRALNAFMGESNKGVPQLVRQQGIFANGEQQPNCEHPACAGLIAIRALLVRRPSAFLATRLLTCTAAADGRRLCTRGARQLVRSSCRLGAAVRGARSVCADSRPTGRRHGRGVRLRAHPHRHHLAAARAAAFGSAGQHLQSPDAWRARSSLGVGLRGQRAGCSRCRRLGGIGATGAPQQAARIFGRHLARLESRARRLRQHPLCDAFPGSCPWR